MVWNDVPPELLAEILKLDDPKKLPQSWRYRFPPGLLVIAGLIVLGVVAAIFGKTDEERAREKYEELMADSRYREALEIVKTRSEEDAERGAAQAASESPEALEEAVESGDEESDGGYSEAIKHLVDNGVEEQEAQENLAFLIHVLVAASEAQAVAAHPSVPADINEGRIADFLVGYMECIDTQCTFFRALQSIHPSRCPYRSDDRGFDSTTLY